MEFRELTPEEVARTRELAESSYRPPQILALRAEIDGDIRAAELRATVTGVVDQAQVDAIVEKKFQLDTLYTAWLEGRLG